MKGIRVKPLEEKLSDKQKAWVDFYKQGKTPAEAARLAGYKAKDNNAFGSIGFENLQKLANFIKDRDDLLDKGRVADMEEINAFWTQIMRDKNEDIKNRLKASELRAKAAGGFVDKVVMRGVVDTSISKLDRILSQLEE